jgi:hypothetical protein
MIALAKEVPESVSTALARWASQAPTHLLRVLAWAGAFGAIGVFLIDATRWPFAVAMVALASLGGWGLAEHRSAIRHSRTIGAIEWVLAAIGGVTALTAIFLAIFWMLGPAPHF